MLVAPRNFELCTLDHTSNGNGDETECEKLQIAVTLMAMSKTLEFLMNSIE